MTDTAPIHSEHVFLFPFAIRPGHGDVTETTRLFPALFDNLCRAGWTYAPFAPTAREMAWNEYFYFHESVRASFFETRDESKIRTAFDANRDWPAMCSFKRPCQEAKLEIQVRGVETPYTLEVGEIRLDLFSTMVGVVSLYLTNRTYADALDVLIINDFGRRLYPQFLANGTVMTKKKFLAKSITLDCPGLGKVKEAFEGEDFFVPQIRIGSHMQAVIGQSILDSYRITPIIDDRMFTVCWYGNQEVVDELCGQDRQRCGNNHLTSDFWYKFIFVDNRELGVARKPDKKRLTRAATYSRWIESGTYYGLSRYSLVCLTNQGDTPVNVLRQHMLHQYRRMALILLQQRASLLKFSSEIASISADIRQAWAGADGKTVAEKASRLQAVYLDFINRLWFVEVTPQEQGIEMYDMARKAMNLDQLAKEVSNEIREVYEYAALAQERRRNINMETLNGLAALALPVVLVTTLWSTGFISNVFFPESKVSLGSWLLAAAAFITTCVGVYAITRHILRRIAGCATPPADQAGSQCQIATPARELVDLIRWQTLWEAVRYSQARHWLLASAVILAVRGCMTYWSAS